MVRENVIQCRMANGSGGWPDTDCCPATVMTSPSRALLAVALITQETLKSDCAVMLTETLKQTAIAYFICRQAVFEITF